MIIEDKIIPKQYLATLSFLEEKCHLTVRNKKYRIKVFGLFG